jgi:hypothetical protein
MFRFVVVASLLIGCRISLEDSDTGDDISGGRRCTTTMPSQPCMDAVNHSDLAWIEQKVFAVSCNFSGCHKTASDAGKLDLTPGVSHDHLVNVPSMIESSRMLVVPNDVSASYLMLMLGDFPPATASPPGTDPPLGIGYMPQAQPQLCCQKLDAVERWINAGAPGT